MFGLQNSMFGLRNSMFSDVIERFRMCLDVFGRFRFLRGAPKITTKMISTPSAQGLWLSSAGENENENKSESENENESGRTCARGAKRPRVGRFSRYRFRFRFNLRLI